MEVGENKIQNHKAGVDDLDRLAATVAEIVLPNDAVNAARIEVVNVSVVGVGGGAGVAACKDSGGQAMHDAAVVLVGELEILARREVARMGGDEIEKGRFGVGVTEAAVALKCSSRMFIASRFPS